MKLKDDATGQEFHFFVNKVLRPTPDNPNCIVELAAIRPDLAPLQGKHTVDHFHFHNSGWKSFLKLLIIWCGKVCYRFWSTLVQVMAWCLDGTKPLPKPMLTYDQWHLPEDIWMEFRSYVSDINREIRLKIFFEKWNTIWAVFSVMIL